MTFRSLATTQGYQMRFFVSGDFSTVYIGYRFSIQGGFKAFCDNTLFALLDLCGGHLIGRRNVFMCPPTGPLRLQENRGVKDRTALGRIFGDTIASYRPCGVYQVHGISDGHCLSLTLRLESPYFNRIFQRDKALALPARADCQKAGAFCRLFKPNGRLRKEYRMYARS